MGDYSDEQLKSYLRAERVEVRDALRSLEREVADALTKCGKLRDRIQELEDALTMAHPSQLLPGYTDERLKAVISAENLKANQELHRLERSVEETNTQISARRRRLQELDGSLGNL